jgi:hypothetical protein
MNKGGRVAIALLVLVSAGGLAASVGAQSAPTGKEIALGLPDKCADKAEVDFALTPDGQGLLGRWVTVEGPTFGLPPEAPRPGLKAHAVDPKDPRRLFASDGYSIQRSLDGGCTWAEVHSVPRDPLTTDLTGQYVSGGISQMAVSGTGPSSRVWAFWTPGPDTSGQVRAFVSDDGGATWQERSAGLPAAYAGRGSANTPVVGIRTSPCAQTGCRGEALAVAQSDPEVAYIALTRVASEPGFFSTDDGGRTWRSTSLFGFFGFVSPAGLEVDPVDPASLWMISGGRLFRSGDGGQSFSPVNEADSQQLAGLHLSRHDGTLNVSVFKGARDQEGALSYQSVLRSRDGGASFVDTELTSPLRGSIAVAPGGDPASMLLTTSFPDGVAEYREPSKTTQSLGTPRLGKVEAPQRDATADPVVWTRRFASLAAYVPGALPPGRFPPRPRFDPVAGKVPTLRTVPGDLVPSTLDADLGAEGTREFDYRVNLPSLPTPVDIWLLVDTSGSMAGAHRGLQQGMEKIVAELAKAGMDAWYGVAVFPDGLDIPYGRYHDLAPAGPELYSALGRLGTGGGGNELHPTALYQSVTGAGQPDAGVAPGLGASFRPEALKIIVHATDEAYGFDPAGPTTEEAAEALLAAGVRHVGLDLSNGAVIPEAGDALSMVKRDHDYVAEVTGTFAPEGGVDCNGDGLKELEEGDPLTCPINRATDVVDIAPTIVAAVRAVRDETAVELTVSDDGGLKIDVADAVRSPINLRVRNSIPFKVRFTCPPQLTGGSGTARFLVTVRGAPSGTGVARIGCGEPVPAAAVKPPSPKPPPALVPLVLAPPQIVPNLEPAISPLQQPAPSQVAAPSAQPGVAAQPGELETAKQRSGSSSLPSDPESGRSSDPSPATTGTLAAGAGLAVGTGAWAARRERAQAPARKRA